jgi:uroporphyrinogen-III decarboxylase
MKDGQWEALLGLIRGERPSPLPTGFIIDSPWLPNWAGHSILDYFTSERLWFEAHQKAHDAFPDTWFLPGFWSEYGMCTEPSAFGAVSMWSENEFPFARRIVQRPDDVERLERPNPKQDGLLPFVIKRLTHHRAEIERSGHKIRFAVARGPLNVASFLMGTTEFLTALKTDPQRMHRLLDLITEFLVDWIACQRECIPTIDGVLVLDDLVGFIGRNDFQTFAMPYLKRIFALDVAVKFFHNDAPCKVAAPSLAELGINLLNFGIQHTLSDMFRWTENKIVLLGNVPPRDVLAQGTAEEVRAYTKQMLEALPDRSRLIVSCAGGMPPGAPTENIHALIDAARATPG